MVNSEIAVKTPENRFSASIPHYPDLCGDDFSVGNR